MFVFLSKLLPLFVYPLGFSCLLIILALFLQWQPGWRRAVQILALLILWISGNRWFSEGLALSLEARYQTPDPIPQEEVMVVLGGGTDPAEAPRKTIEMNGAGDRVIYAARLYREGKARQILVSGGLLAWDAQDSTPAAEMASLLEWLGVPNEAIWQQDRSQNTAEDALFCAQILRERGINRILLVTSAWHMPRSVKLFEAQGLEVIPLPTDYNVTQASWERSWKGDWREVTLNLFPSVDNLGLTTRMLKEYFGLFMIKLKDWMG
jgi:uncharacterized SAM-binding protein YcdF (DUF218 family)